MNQQVSHDPSFELLDSTSIDSLNIEVQHYRHLQTGADHYHLASDNNEKVFLVALRTMPKDSTGVAHILEHTALCGSDKYPVRDPFFMMTRRSLNTFMNAMTSSDWTAYPFASQNNKDFNNLLDVYLDAVFFARLHELDFAQEGHRLEFSEMENASSPLEFKGVVFNEMKGAMSSPVSQLWQGISSYIFPTVTYHYNSGGEPAEITELSYQQLKDFYQEHYHPSNAIFMTFGDLDVQDMQSKMHLQALEKFEAQAEKWTVPLEQRYAAPVKVERAYGADIDESSEQSVEEQLADKTHHVMGWLLGESTDLKQQLEAHLLSQVLLDNSASPLRNALEKCDFASAVSPLCGLEDSNREMAFMCGVEGSNLEDANKFEELVFNALNDVAENGIDQELVDSALHQLEFHQREIGGDHYPYGMQLIMGALSAATHYGDPVALLNIDPVLKQLEADAKDSAFIPNLIKKHLLANRHYVRYTMVPDAELNKAQETIETEKLSRIQDSLTDDEKQAIVDQSLALKARQEEQDDGEVLPSVGLADVDPAVSVCNPDQKSSDAKEGDDYTSYSVATNGVIYQQLIVGLPELSLQQVKDLPLLSYVWTEVGTAGSDYLAQQKKQAAYCGGLSSYGSLKPHATANDNWIGYYTMSGKALSSKSSNFVGLMQESWSSAKFDELERLQDLVQQYTARRLQSITGSGHSLAMQVASAQLTPMAALLNETTGLPFFAELKDIQLQLMQGHQNVIQDLAGRMESLQKLIASQPKHLLLVQDQQLKEEHVELSKTWQLGKGFAVDGFSIEESGDAGYSDISYWMVDSQVNFCSEAFRTVPSSNADSPALSVAAGILRNGFLHSAIREKGGAYGAGATQDGGLGIFKFYSYRDPRVAGTFDDFAASVDWLLQLDENESSDELVEQAILGLIGSMDRPSSPAGDAKLTYHAELAGRDEKFRQENRNRLLAVTMKDVKRVVNQYLKEGAGNSAKAVVAPKGTEDIAASLGLKATAL